MKAEAKETSSTTAGSNKHKTATEEAQKPQSTWRL